MTEPAVPVQGVRQGELLDGGRRRRDQRLRTHHRSEVARPVRVSLWLPLTPLWALLAPFALLLAPLLALVRETRGVNPYRAAFAIGAVLFALSGVNVFVNTRDARVRIRIF